MDIRVQMKQITRKVRKSLWRHRMRDSSSQRIHVHHVLHHQVGDIEKLCVCLYLCECLCV